MDWSVVIDSYIVLLLMHTGKQMTMNRCCIYCQMATVLLTRHLEWAEARRCNVNRFDPTTIDMVTDGDMVTVDGGRTSADGLDWNVGHWALTRCCDDLELQDVRWRTGMWETVGSCEEKLYGMSHEICRELQPLTWRNIPLELGHGIFENFDLDLLARPLDPYFGLNIRTRTLV